ncbi:hypothetical protein Pst134EB_012581 [Puccinia striiformis f. sp. tritici]|nr:hypothetical protein Pst134EB_012581 [Puccinia striiformis f. sp. tritici]
MFSQIGNQQQQQQQSEASNQLRLLKRSIESTSNNSSSSNNNNNKKKITNNNRHTEQLKNIKSTPVRSRQPPPHRSTLSARLSSKPTKNRQSRIIGNQSQSETAIDTLRKLLQSRWDPVTKLLDLANLAQDKILKAAGIAPPGQKGAPLKTAGAIWKLCTEICPNVRSISLADNQLQSLQPMSISSLVTHFPELSNLSLSGNRLSSYTDLNPLSSINQNRKKGNTTSTPAGFKSLRELILTGNPIRLNAEKDGPQGLQTYLFEVVRRFPSLEVLDGEAIDPIMKATITTASLNGSTSMSKPSGDSLLLPIQPPLPLSIKPAFFNDSTTSSFVASFCLQFFKAFDENRQSLMDVYATKSSFSLCASPYIPCRSKMAGLTRNRPEMPAQQVPTWNEYINISRNNARLKGAKLSERIANGPAEIIEYMKRIPGTKHPIQSAEDQHKFVVDSWQMPGLVNESTSSSGAVIYVTIHGEFQEFPSLTVRSFDRTFMLGAAGPASAAALKGWPCVILTDQLTVRGYSSPQAWSTTAPLPQTTIPNSVPILASSLPTPTSTVSAQPELTSEQKNQLVQKLMDLTKLNMNFTIDCLTQNHWDLDNSIKNFNDILSRGGLPSDAFLHQLP